ncbi:MAG: RpiB/LacA/LacB family sugar-phosphate isomerase, partial [Ignavibacteriaceae bacterium]
MKILIASDHGGFELKSKISLWLKENNYTFVDLGNHKYDPLDDYPDFAIKIGEAISKGEAKIGILICGSGVGASVTANKIKGVRASVCHDSYSARQGVEHDDMNILCLGARVIGEQLAFELVNAFINA